MIIVTLMELIVMAFLFYLGITQIILPLWRNTPFLPMFRKERCLQNELVEATEKVVEAKLEKEIAEITHRAESVRKTVRRPTRSKIGPGGTVNQ